MKQAILISIKPKWVEKIVNGEKTIEIRKTMPKCELPIDVYIYCTKEKKRIELIKRDLYTDESTSTIINGKVIASFRLTQVAEINIDDKKVQEQACLTETELHDYLYSGNSHNKNIKKCYAWHIDWVFLLDKPKKISEFKTRHYPQFAGLVKNKTHYELRQLTKAPQSWCYVEVEYD